MTKLLLIDDEPRVARALTYAVGGRDFEIVHTGDPVTAVDLAASSKADAILLDINLGAANGLEVCRRLKADARTRHLPVLLLSGNVDDATKIAGFAAGADDFVTKPFAPGDLLLRVDAQLGKAAR